MKGRLGILVTCILAATLLAVGVHVSRADVNRPDRPAIWEGDAASDDSEVPSGPVFEDVSAIHASQDLTPRLWVPVLARNAYGSFSFVDRFDDWGSGWPWGSSPYSYGYELDGDTSTVYQMGLTGNYRLAFVTAPTFAGRNFDYRVWMRRATTDVPKYWGDEYGIFVSPTPIDPQSLVGQDVYTFHMEIRADSAYNSYYAIYKWNTLSRSDRVELDKHEEGTNMTDVARFWNEWRIVRTGDTLNFYVKRANIGSWAYVHSLTDSSLPNILYVGLYACHSSTVNGDYFIKFQWDNVALDVSP